eukprot:ctg_2109.g551
MRAARYAYLGGFDATSNVMAGLAYGIPTRGTHAHSFVQSYSGAELQWQQPPPSNGPTADASRAAFEARVRQIRDEVVHPVLMHQFQVSAQSSNESELAAFVAYALAFPDAFLALVDTYDTLTSGVPNFLAVALALEQGGHPPLGIRIDSGDLAHISMEARRMFKAVAPASTYRIFASSDLNEDTLYALREQGHSIDAFGIGTHLVTCLKQPALGERGAVQDHRAGAQAGVSAVRQGPRATDDRSHDVGGGGGAASRPAHALLSSVRGAQTVLYDTGACGGDSAAGVGGRRHRARGGRRRRGAAAAGACPMHRPGAGAAVRLQTAAEPDAVQGERDQIAVSPHTPTVAERGAHTRAELMRNKTARVHDLPVDVQEAGGDERASSAAAR